MFQYDKICQLKALPHRVQNVFWQELDSNQRAHSCTRILDWGFSWAWLLRPLGHSALFPSTHFFSFDLRPLHWVIFSFQRCNLLNGLCHPYEKICVQTHEYFRVSHVSAGYLLFCALENRSAVGHRWCCHFLFFFALDCYLQLTFLCDRICRLKALPHRVQNVVWQESDSNPRTHSCTRILDWGISWVWLLRPSAILPGLRGHIFFWFVAFPLGNFFNSEI